MSIIVSNYGKQARLNHCAQRFFVYVESSLTQMEERFMSHPKGSTGRICDGVAKV